MVSPTPTRSSLPRPASLGHLARESASPRGFWKIRASMNSRSSGLGAAASRGSCKGKFTRTARSRSRGGGMLARPATCSPRTRRRTEPCCFRCCPGRRLSRCFPILCYKPEAAQRPASPWSSIWKHPTFLSCPPGSREGRLEKEQRTVVKE